MLGLAYILSRVNEIEATLKAQAAPQKDLLYTKLAHQNEQH